MATVHRYYFVVDPDRGKRLSSQDSIVSAAEMPRWWPSSRSVSAPSRGPIEGNAKIEFDAKRRDKNAQLQKQRCAPLCDEEIWGGRLYTGPMFQKVCMLRKRFMTHHAECSLDQSLNESFCSDFVRSQYNSVLRGIKAEPDSRANATWLRLTKGNTYTTTLHCINSTIVVRELSQACCDPSALSCVRGVHTQL